MKTFNEKFSYFLDSLTREEKYTYYKIVDHNFQFRQDSIYINFFDGRTAVICSPKRNKKAQPIFVPNEIIEFVSFFIGDGKKKITISRVSFFDSYLIWCARNGKKTIKIDDFFDAVISTARIKKEKIGSITVYVYYPEGTK